MSLRVGSVADGNCLYRQNDIDVYSSPLINLQPNRDKAILMTNLSELNMNKISIKLKNFFAQLEDLKEMAQNLHYKEFKYDHFQIDDLENCIQQIQKRVYNLEKDKYELSSKIN